jgi:hypothetical protein
MLRGIIDGPLEYLYARLLRTRSGNIIELAWHIPVGEPGDQYQYVQSFYSKIMLRLLASPSFKRSFGTRFHWILVTILLYKLRAEVAMRCFVL